MTSFPVSYGPGKQCIVYNPLLKIRCHQWNKGISGSEAVETCLIKLCEWLEGIFTNIGRLTFSMSVSAPKATSFG